MTTHPRTLGSIGASASLSSAAANTLWSTLLDYFNDLIDGTDDYVRLIGSTESLSILSGSVGVQKNFAIIDTQSSAASDDLDTINGYGEGRILFVRQSDAARVVTMKHGTGNLTFWGGADIVLSATKWTLLIGTAAGWSDSDATSTTGGAPGKFNGRLTLTSGTPVTTGDVTAATNVYVTPFRGNRVALYNTTSLQWVEHAFTEITISLSGKAANTNYDVFLYLSGSSVVAEMVAWTDATNRATALTTQNGVYVKNGATDRLYVGTVRTTATIGQCEDSLTKRYVWNYFNRVVRNMVVKDTTDSWTYATTTWRSKNNSTSNRVEFIRGVNEEPVIADNIAVSAGAVSAVVGWGLDSTSALSSDCVMSLHSDTGIGSVSASYEGFPSEGYHYLQALEIASGATATFYGDAGVSYFQTGCRARFAA